jgi:predicted lysophospholipase L1 biosynthesis ABC-type transport system permease subunit
VGLGAGSVITIAGYENAVCAPSSKLAMYQQAALEETGGGGLLVRVVPGSLGEAAVRHYVDAYQSITALPSAPLSLVNFGEAVNFPLIFGVMLALFGASTLVHLLVVSVSRRRRETGLLKALGFVKAQVASAVAWQATTLALVGIVVGVPVGVVVGEAIWRVFETDLGAIPVAVVPLWPLVALIGSVVVVANLLAVTPALAAARTNPAQLLRAP